MELATQVAPGINTSETDLRTNFFEFMSVLWKRDYFCEFNGRLTFVTVTHVDDLFYAYVTRCKTTKSLLDAIVKEFNMSRKEGDSVFRGRRVRVTPEALIVSQELAASSLTPMELCGTQRSPETMLTYSEHREYRSLLGKLQWLLLQSRPHLSRSDPCSTTSQRTHSCRCSSTQCNFSQSSAIFGNHFEISTRSDQCFLGSAGDVWRRLLRQHGRFEESVRRHRVFEA